MGFGINGGNLGNVSRIGGLLSVICGSWEDDLVASFSFWNAHVSAFWAFSSILVHILGSFLISNWFFSIWRSARKLKGQSNSKPIKFKNQPSDSSAQFFQNNPHLNVMDWLFLVFYLNLFILLVSLMIEFFCFWFRTQRGFCLLIWWPC